MIQTLTGIHSCNDLKAIKHAKKASMCTKFKEAHLTPDGLLDNGV